MHSVVEPTPQPTPAYMSTLPVCRPASIPLMRRRHLVNSTGDTTYRPPKIDGYNDLAELELRKLEDVKPGTALPVTYVIARGFAAVTYAVLALRDTCQDQGTDVSNTLSSLAGAAGDYAGRITWAAEETADYTGRLAGAAGALPWWRRLARQPRPGRRDGEAEEP